MSRLRKQRSLVRVSMVALVVLVWMSTTLIGPASAVTVFADGFESGGLSSWSASARFSAQQQSVHTGSWAGRASSTGAASNAWRSFTGGAELWATVWFNVASRTTAAWVTSLRKAGGGAVLLVGVNKNGALIARNQASGTVYTSTTVATNGGWHRLFVHAKMGSAGRFDVELDGSVVAALSRTNNLGSGTIGRLMVGDTATGRTFSVAFDDVSVATDPGSSDTGPPTQPMGLIATTVDESSVDLAWQPSTDDIGVTGYTVYRSPDGTFFSPVGSTSITTHRDTGLAPGTTYWWVVEAQDAAGHRSAWSTPATATTHPVTTPGTVGRWSAPFAVDVKAVHASVLFTGDVLLFYQVSGTIGTVAKLWDPATGAVKDVSIASTFEHNLFCAANSIRPNGDVFVTGGTLWGGTQPNGTERTVFFDPVSETWRAGPPMASRRWYPTDVLLPDGDTLVFSGTVSSGVFAQDVERYDGAADSFSTLGPGATRQMATYPKMFVLPDGRIVRVGPETQTLFFDPAAESWTAGPSMGVTRFFGAAVLLPGLQRILAIGGAGGGAGIATAEILELGGTGPIWRSTSSMHERRRNVNAVLLPDGKVLAVGGNRGTGNYDDPVLQPEVFDPATEQWTRMAPQTAPRAYHATAVLLPDGRVLSAGQTSGTMQTTAEIYEPPYLFAGPRPLIGSAPQSLGYGGAFEVGSDRPSDIARVVLIRASSVTHGVSFDQRYVTLPFTAGSGTLSVSEPPSSSEAPPGWYMLFLVDDTGVPSVATWVQVS